MYSVITTITQRYYTRTSYDCTTLSTLLIIYYYRGIWVQTGSRYQIDENLAFGSYDCILGGRKRNFRLLGRVVEPYNYNIVGIIIQFRGRKLRRQLQRIHATILCPSAVIIIIINNNNRLQRRVLCRQLRRLNLR